MSRLTGEVREAAKKGRLTGEVREATEKSRLTGEVREGAKPDPRVKDPMEKSEMESNLFRVFIKIHDRRSVIWEKDHEVEELKRMLKEIKEWVGPLKQSLEDGA